MAQPDRPIDVGDYVRIGRWGKKVYRVVYVVRIAAITESAWMTLEPVDAPGFRGTRQTVIEGSRLHREDPPAASAD